MIFFLPLPACTGSEQRLLFYAWKTNCILMASKSSTHKNMVASRRSYIDSRRRFICPCYCMAYQPLLCLLITADFARRKNAAVAAATESAASWKSCCCCCCCCCYWWWLLCINDPPNQFRYRITSQIAKKNASKFSQGEKIHLNEVH